MFSSPRLSRPPMDIITTKHILHEKCQTIEQLKTIIDDLNVRHEKKERELIKQIGTLYNDLQQTKRKMAHLILKYQQQKKFNENIKTLKDFSCQTDENSPSFICRNCSTSYDDTKSYFIQTNMSEQHPKYYTLQRDDDRIEYISAAPQPQSHHSLSSPSLSTTDPSSIKHNESSSSAYNTAESLPSSTYSDENESLERVLNAACTMYTTHNNLEHTIKLQEELFRQRLRLRGINLNANNNNNNDNHDDNSSEHFYDNIDSETSDIEKKTTIFRNRSLPWSQKKQQRTVTFNLTDSEQQKPKVTQPKVRFSDQCYSLGKRKNFKSSKTNLAKLINNKKYCCQNPNIANKKLLSSNMLTVTIT